MLGVDMCPRLGPRFLVVPMRAFFLHDLTAASGRAPVSRIHLSLRPSPGFREAFGVHNQGPYTHIPAFIDNNGQGGYRQLRALAIRSVPGLRSVEECSVGATSARSSAFCGTTTHVDTTLFRLFALVWYVDRGIER